jgi:hypothetical protein
LRIKRIDNHNTLHSEGLSNGAIGRLKRDKGNNQRGTKYLRCGDLNQRGQKERTPPTENATKIPDANAPKVCRRILDNHMPRSPPRDHYQKHLADL